MDSMGFALLNPSYGISLVGWVERSETHHLTAAYDGACPMKSRLPMSTPRLRTML
jgi:hypothetical protein